MNTSLILLIVVLFIYLAWKLMGTGQGKRKGGPRRFNIGRHRKKIKDEEDEDEE